MIKKHKWQLIISSLIILFPIVVGLVIWNFLPEQIVTHWNGNGEADGWSGRSFTIFGLPIILFVVHWICVFFTACDPKNKDQSSKVFNMVLWLLPITSLLVCGSTYTIALGNDVNIGMAVRVLLGLMFLILGNYMPKCKKNHTIGVKVIWALRNEENWNKTHRFTGRLWVLCGFLLLATMFVSMKKYIYIFLPLIFIMAFAPMVYSYVYYRKQLKVGTVTKEDVVLTTSEKKTTKISMVVGIIILAFAVIFLITGKFDVILDETSFTIDATYWDDATVNYSEIDDIEYREQDEPNAFAGRNCGYESFNLLMGEFENDEFGMYTRYSYRSCDSCIVLTVDEKVLVFNGKDEEQTKAIYDQLIKKISK